jgi:heterodisulfide reductase subunit C
LILRAEYLSSDDSLKLKDAAEICLKCGVCCVISGHSCHVQYDERFNARQTYVYDCLGSEDPVENTNIWLCVSCHKCEEICPYEVSPVKFIEAMKAEAFRRNLIHPVMLGEVENILSSGFAFPITSSAERQRERLGLEPLQTAVADELRLIAEKTGFSRSIDRIKGDGG